MIISMIIVPPKMAFINHLYSIRAAFTVTRDNFIRSKMFCDDAF